MKIVICGSLSSRDLLLHVERELNTLFPGSNIVTPVNEVRQEKSLIDIQREYIMDIETADLIVVIPKHIKTMRDGGQDMLFTFGESTTYEMALAHVHTKPVMIWKDWQVTQSARFSFPMIERSEDHESKKDCKEN